MGSKLDATCADLSRLATALKTEKSSLLDEGRKQRKQERNWDKLYGGMEKPGKNLPGGSSSPKKAKKPKAPTKAPAPAPAPVTPRTPVQIISPADDVQPPKQPTAAVVKIVSTPSQSRPASQPAAAPKPIVTTKKPPSLLARLGKLPSFLQGGKPPQDKNEPPRGGQAPGGLLGRLGKIKGTLKRFAGLFSGRKRLNDDVFVPSTVLALYLSEERSSTTFKKCAKGALVSTKGLRHSLPKNMFVNPDKDNPTYPIRSDCRPSLAGVGRALQGDMANSNEAITKQAMQRVNQMGGTRGKTRLRLWGTGKGGKRMETFRGAPGTPKRTGKVKKLQAKFGKKAAKLHGVSTGRADNQKHTPPYSPPGGSKGAAGNREVYRHPEANSKPKGKLKSKGSQKRAAAQEAGTIKRGKRKIGR